MLRERLAHHESAVALLQTACQHLSTFCPSPVYEIHIQKDAPHRTSIMVLGHDLGAACHKARRLDIEYNDRPGSSLELFIRCGEIRMAIHPSDAYDLLPEGCREFTFTLDTRILASFGPMVFKVGAEMPSAWYATSPTPERTAVLA